MIWGQNKRGQKIGIINWTDPGLREMSSGQVDSAIRNAAKRCKDEGAASFVLIVDVEEGR